VQKVSSPRLVETPFRSPQLTLFDLGLGEWVLYWRAPDYAPRARKRRIEGLVQPPLFDLQPVEKVVGGNEISPSSRGWLRVIPSPSDDNESCSDRYPLLLDLSAWTRATHHSRRDE
jgi:hypothetical protein